MPGGAFTRRRPRPGACAKPEGRGSREGDRGGPRRGMPVIHVWYVVDKGAPGLKLNAPLFQAVAGGALVRGSPGRGAGRPRAETRRPRRREDAHERLPGHEPRDAPQGLGVESVVITGAGRTSRSSTRRHAADAGYQAIVVTDATSTMNDEWQHAALDYALTNIAERVPTADVVAALKAKALPKKKTTSARSGAKPRRAAAKK